MDLIAAISVSGFTWKHGLAIVVGMVLIICAVIVPAQKVTGWTWRHGLAFLFGVGLLIATVYITRP